MTTAPTTSPTRAKDRRNRDDLVMATAIRIIAQKGYAATSVQMVADEVGVQKGSLYHYLKSKEDLLHRIFKESHEQTEKRFAALQERNLSTEDELYESIREAATWFLQNIDRTHIFFTEMRNLSGDRLADAQAWGRTFERRFSDPIERGQHEGTVRTDVDRRLLTRFVLGALNNVRFWPSRSGHPFENDEMIETLVELIRSALQPRNADFSS